MKRRIVIVTIVILLGLPIPYSSSAPEKVQPKTPPSHAHWSAPPEAAKRANPIQRDQESIARGKELFQTHCVVCHGPGGKGDGTAAAGLKPKPPNLVKMAGHPPDGDIAWKIAIGRGPMPGWKKIISEEDIWHLTNFIQSLGEHTSAQ